MTKNSAKNSSSLGVQPYTDTFAAEVSGIDLARPLSPEISQEIRNIFGYFGVLVFRDQTLTPTQFSDFSKNLGPLHVHHLAESTFPDHPEVRVLSNVKKKGKYIGQYHAGHYWHTDLIFLEQVGYATILHGVECPPEGADTLFADVRTAYDEMPDAMRRQLEGKMALHDHVYSYNTIYPERPPLTERQISGVPPVHHPMICVHPQTGRKAVYLTVPTTRTLGDLNEQETSALLRDVEKICTQDKYVYAHKWQKGDVLMWDNLCCMHAATSFDEKYDRIMYRTQILHEGPVPAA